MKSKKKNSPDLDLIRKCCALIEIVEGVRSREWSFQGMRLKDTPEWVCFYVAVRQK